jgi:CHAD domain-containing protein
MRSDARDFLLPEGLTLEAARAELAAHLSIVEVGGGESDSRFYETFDGLLFADGLACVYAEERLAVVDRASGDELAGGHVGPWPSSVRAAELDAGPLREALSRVIEVRALLPVARVRSRLHVLGVVDSAEKTVVRVTLETPTVVASSLSEREVPLRARVRLEAVRGYDQELAGVRRTLAEELGLSVASEPLVDEAVRASGGAPGGTSAKIEVPLSFAERSDVAAVAVLSRLLEVIEANLEGTIADVDSEFLHDFRVAVRRTRSVLRELRGVFPREPLARWRTEFRWLQQVTGPARDLDVYVLDFDEFRNALPEAFRADLEPLLTVLRTRRLIARREMARELRSERATSLLSGWKAFLDGLADLPEDDRPDAARPIGSVAGGRIRAVYRRMLRMGRAIDDLSPPEALHDLRKKGKELRYLLELFAVPLYPSDVVKPMIKTLKSLQDVLGRHQDREVQISMLRSLTSEVSALPGGDAALMAMGLLVARLGEDERAARTEFASRFAEFASKSQRKLVKKTFG